MQFHLLIAVILVIIDINLAFATIEAPLPQPLPKRGSCPSAYIQSGNYCIPTQSAHFAVAKNGPCPPGYTTSSNYCLALNGARYVIPKEGPCPSGWTQSTNYCMRLPN